MAALNAGNPSPLRADYSLMLTVMQQYRFTETHSIEDDDWSVTIAAYVYAFETELTSGGSRRELIAYHWDPDGVSGVSHPHLHVGQGLARTESQVGPKHFHKMHLPTGHVAVGDIVVLAIREFGAEPLRNDWESVLQAARDVLR